MTSELAIYDVEDRSTKTVLVTDRLIEAPNWTPDGRTLIVNGDGRLFRVELNKPELSVIDTNFATALNNDHGVSPDGKTVVISDASRSGESEIYTLPIGGGTPEPLGAASPAYWHGWSPDGLTLAYVARRDGAFQVCTKAASGGDERRLTTGFDHCDGPDYTPDGRWIWFNGEIDGKVDLWRIPAQGGTPEKMTDDARVNWFPHPSPDGRLVLYLAYDAGTAGHPRDRDVELRLMPFDGGPCETVQRFWGGQGSINVPNWAPDGRRFAFVRYEKGVS